MCGLMVRKEKGTGLPSASGTVFSHEGGSVDGVAHPRVSSWLMEAS